jgi:ABC-2 type transport system ATP-binding protein
MATLASFSSPSPGGPALDDHPILAVRGVEKAFGKTRVLQGIDLAIPQGAVVGLLGTNGSGKSTLIKCLVGLLKPDAGDLTIFGESCWNLSALVKSRFGYVPQELRLFPWMKVKHVINYIAAFYPNWDYDLSERLLDEWKLPREHRVGPLSAGEMQKLAIVLALGHRPELLILDEPVASLDPIARREFLRSIMDLAEDQRHTILFSTHITSDLERVATHVALLRDGRIAFHEELDALKDRVKRVRLTRTADFPPHFTIDGALHVEVAGGTAKVTLTHVSDQLVDDLRRIHLAEVSVEDLNLEEIFLELHGDGQTH